MGVEEETVKLHRRLDGDIGFLGEFPDERAFARLTRFDAAAGKMPARGIGMFHEQHGARRIDHDPAHAERHRPHRQKAQMRYARP